MPNSIARNGKLSFRARGLLVMLLSLPPEWHVTADMLATFNPDSRTAIRTAMQELRDTGYVGLHRHQDARGRWRSDLEVFDSTETERALSAFGATCGNDANPQVAPNAGKPAAGKPAGNRKTGSRGGAHAAGAAPPKAADRCRRCGSDRHTRDECTL